MGKAIAADINLSSQGDETNSKNVKFDVYLDEADRNVKEKAVDMNSEDAKLFVSVVVQGGGYLNNAQVELVNTNFKLKNSPEVTKFKLDSIQSEKGVAAGLPIVAKKDESYNLGLLDMQSQIKLTGEYIDDKGNVTDINTTKAVKVSWTLDELTNEDIELNEQVITNKIYSIDGVNKRVVQVLVSSKVKENKAPVKSSAIEIANPEIGVNPEEVKVAGYTTKATNGKASLDFANGEKSSWEYKAEEGKTYINVLNNAVEENVVAWAKSAEDKFVVTYIYDETAVVAPFISNVKNTVDVYGRTNGTIEKVAELKLEELADVGDIAKIESNVTKNIYRGKMYIGEDTSFETRSSVYVPYNKIANTITVEDLEDKVLAGEEVVEGIDTYYKTTKINKAEALKILGTEGTIKVYNADDKTAPIKEIVLSEETEEDYYTISYEENVNKIAIEMSAAITEGTIGIVNEKAIKVSNIDIAKTLTELKTNTNLSVADANGTAMVNSSVEIGAKLLEPSTAFNMSLDKKSLSALAENDVRITAELKAKDESNKLYKNPVINIELPKEIKEASIVNITPVVGSDELTVKSNKVITNEAGNKVIVVELQGEQTKYSANAANIVIDVKMKTDAFMANKDVEIKSTCINDGETASKISNVEIVTKKGLITKNYLKIGEEVTEKINNNNIEGIISANEEIKISSKIINNFGEEISGINIVGRIPEDIVLNSNVITNLENAVIYYSEEENAQITSDTWKTNVTNFENIKSFKIAIEKLAQAEAVELNYSSKLKQDSKASGILNNALELNYNIDNQAKQEKINFNFNVINSNVMTVRKTEDFVMTLQSKTTSNTLHQGQIVTYEVKVQNISGVQLNNLKLEYIIPEGATYTELTDAQGDEMEWEDSDVGSQSWNIETLKAGETVSKEVTIKINNNAKTIENKVYLKDAEGQTLQQIETEATEVKNAKLEVRLSRRDNMEIEIDEKDTIRYVVIVKNTSEGKMQNLIVKSNIPENTKYIEDSEYNKDWTYDSEKNTVSYKIPEIGANETKVLSFEVQVTRFPQDVLTAKIDNTVVVTTEENEEYETNVFTSNIRTVRWTINQTIENNKELKEGEKVKYIITVKNVGTIGKMVSVIDEVTDRIQVRSAKVYINDELDNEEDVFTNNTVNVSEVLESGKTLKIEIEGVTYSLKEDEEKVEIKNIAKIDLGDGEYLESNEIVSTIINEDWVEPEVPTDPKDPEAPETPTDPEDPEDPEAPETPKDPENPTTENNSISGLSWLDKNKDGIRDNDEKVLEAVGVLLLDKDGKEVAKTTTSLTGTYKFDKLAEGEYTVVFKYDTSKYAVTKYQVTGATESTNSDVISKEIEINRETKTVGTTDTIKVDGKTINKNIDIGLIENAKFDLALNKYITKVILMNSSGTSTYEYEDTNLAKVEISAKKIAGTTMIVEYELQITNEGDVDSYVEDVLDYLPNGLVFTSETNKDWYMDGNQVLHNKTMADQVIKPGETKSVELVLTKSLKSDSTGTIENTGEIGASSNKLGITEYDSTAGNKKAGEDDISNASLIVSIATGSPAMYIGIVLASLVVIGMGIYLIDKKVLKGGRY